MTDGMQPLESTINPFGGVLPNPAALPDDTDVFREQLALSLGAWTESGHRVVWLEAPLAKSHVVPVAAEAGFTFHHANDDYVMMTHLLEDDAFIPKYATHYIGAGGAVISDNNKILVVREMRGGTGSGSFKLPGGHLHEGEHLRDGVIREVLEETGIQAHFVSLVCFRNQHGYRHGKSDIYFVCRLKPLTFEITKQDEEIAECVWMPVEDYLSSEIVSSFNKRVVQAALESPGLAPNILDGYRDPSIVEVFLPRDEQDLG